MNCHLIGQRAELARNYELPTTNCDNALRCHLMMDPSTVEEGTKVLGEALGILGEGAITTERTAVGGEEASLGSAGRTRVGREATRKEELTTVSKIADCRSKAAACSLKFEEATVAGNQDLAALWHQALKQHEESAEYYKKSSNNSSLRVVFYDCGHRFSEAAVFSEASATHLEQAAIALEEVTEAREKKQEEQATLKLKITKQYEKSAEYYRQAAEDCSRRNAGGARRFDFAGKAAAISARQLEEAAIILEKATQTAELNQSEVVDLWLEISKQYEETAKYYSQVEDFWSKIHDSSVHADRFGTSAETCVHRLEKAASSLENSIQTMEREEALLWFKSAKQHQETAEYYLQEANDRVKEKGMYSYSNDEDKLAVVRVDYFGLAAIAQYQFHKATEANQEQVAALWQKNAKQYEEVAQYFRHSIGRNFSPHHEVVELVGEHVCELHSTSIALEETIQAMQANQEELAALWLKSANQHQESAGYYLRAVNLARKGSSMESSPFKQVASAFRVSAQKLEKAAIAQEEVIRAKENNQEELAVLWLKTVKQYEESSEYYRQGTDAIQVGNIAHEDAYTEGFSQAGNTADTSALRLEKAAIAQEKAIQARKANQEELGTLWLKISEQNQEAAEYYRQAAEAYSKGNSTNYHGLWQEGDSARGSADRLEDQATRTPL